MKFSNCFPFFFSFISTLLTLLDWYCCKILIVISLVQSILWIVVRDLSFYGISSSNKNLFCFTSFCAFSTFCGKFFWLLCAGLDLFSICSKIKQQLLTKAIQMSQSFELRKSFSLFLKFYMLWLKFLACTLEVPFHCLHWLSNIIPLYLFLGFAFFRFVLHSFIRGCCFVYSFWGYV